VDTSLITFLVGNHGLLFVVHSPSLLNVLPFSCVSFLLPFNNLFKNSTFIDFSILSSRVAFFFFLNNSFFTSDLSSFIRPFPFPPELLHFPEASGLSHFSSGLSFSNTFSKISRFSSLVFGSLLLPLAISCNSDAEQESSSYPHNRMNQSL